MVQLLWKTFWRLLKKLNMELLYDPAVPLLCIYPRELNTCPLKNLYVDAHGSTINSRQKVEITQMFINW